MGWWWYEVMCHVSRLQSFNSTKFHNNSVGYEVAKFQGVPKVNMVFLAAAVI